MNIFYLHDDPHVAATYMYNKHVVKMILESAQMLCTAHHHYGNHEVPYKKAHYNHPSTIWTRSSRNHYYWLYLHMMALGEEYTRRYGKVHSSITKCGDVLRHAPEGMPNLPFEQPPQCMPDEYKDPQDTVNAYRRYYQHTKADFCVWTKRMTPLFMQKFVKRQIK